jgi:biopolymer transport protein ExbD
MNLWPFLGVTLVLLCIFMVNVPPHHDIGPNLQPSSYATALREDAIKVSIIRDGRVFFRNTWVVPEELPGFIRDALHSGAEKKVYLAVDSRSKFADTALVVDQIGKAGIREICFLTEKAAIRQ